MIVSIPVPLPKVRYNAPTMADSFDFLVRCYFGEGNDFLRLCVQRAYLDLSRTLRGFAGYADGQKLREASHEHVVELVRELRIAAPSQDSFDAWHRNACTSLRLQYAQNGFNRFTFGQAQKWLNMTLKYVFVLGEERLPGYAPHYAFAHPPIDNVFVGAAKAVGGPELPMPWSRLDDYDAYFALQRKYRALFTGDAPMAAEFRLWQSA